MPKALRYTDTTRISIKLCRTSLKKSPGHHWNERSPFERSPRGFVQRTTRQGRRKEERHAIKSPSVWRPLWKSRWVIVRIDEERETRHILFSGTHQLHLESHAVTIRAAIFISLSPPHPPGSPLPLSVLPSLSLRALLALLCANS